MLSFHLGMGGFDNPGEYLGGIDMDGIAWLQKNRVIKLGMTGHLPSDPESLTYFDDVVLSPLQVRSMVERLQSRLSILKQTPGFNCEHIDMLSRILKIALDNGTGLSTIAD